MVVGKRCGTCIDRKIRCDRGLPACTNCTRTNRICQGYGLRLSWPRDHDRKRFVIGPVPAGKQHGRRRDGGHAIHATTWDMDVYHYLTETRVAGKSVTPLPFYKELSAVPSTMTTSEMELLYFFESSVMSFLTTLSEEPVGNLIMRIALSGNSPSAVAVQRAILALSYFFRYGAGLQADQLKLSALRALITSAGMSMSSENAVQHVAAGMILCVFEISHHSESSQQWIWYITGAKDVIANAPAGSFSEENGNSCLVDWAYYHEVLAQFSMRHWRPAFLGVRERKYEAEFHMRSNYIDKTVSLCTLFRERNKVLELLSEICKVVLPPSDPRSKSKSYKDSIRALELRVQCSDAFGTPLSRRYARSETERHAAVASELHQIAILIYLARAANSSGRPSEKLTYLVDRGMTILSSLPYCDRPFPVLIIGLEARDDEERLAVLELIARTQRNPYLGHRLECMKNFLRGVWIQAELHAEDGVEFDYVETLTAVLSTSEIMPPLA